MRIPYRSLFILEARKQNKIITPKQIFRRGDFLLQYPFYPTAKYVTIRKDVRQRIFLPWRWKEYE